MSLWGLIRRMDTRRMRSTAKTVAREAGRPAALVFCDMVWCGFRYRAGYLDYALFHFWELNAAQRSTVLTRGKNDRYVAALNSREEWDVFDVKPEFFRRFAPFIGRRWIDLTQATAAEFERFCREQGKFLVKPPAGTHGDGVEIMDAAAVASFPALLERLKKEERTLCEEVLVQHPDLDTIWPGSINHGGMVAPVDKDTGVVLCRARDKAGRLYDCHPGTGTRFEGYQLPLWPEILELVGKAALVVPSIRYVGWDVATTAVKGPALVEGNQYPGHDIYCLPGQNPSKIGIFPVLDAVVPYKSLK